MLTKTIGKRVRTNSDLQSTFWLFESVKNYRNFNEWSLILNEL